MIFEIYCENLVHVALHHNSLICMGCHTCTVSFSISLICSIKFTFKFYEKGLGEIRATLFYTGGCGG